MISQITMSNILQKLETELGKNKIHVNEPMVDRTTFKSGGSAEFFIEIDQIAELIKAIRLAQSLGMQFFILGSGTTCVIPEKGIAGLVIKNNCRRFEIMSMKGRIIRGQIDMSGAAVYTESGVLTNQLVRYAAEQGFGGLEHFLGLPGTIGGALFVNANYPKNNAMLGDALTSAKILTREGEVQDVTGSYLQFSPDSSYLQTSGEILLSAVFKLTPMETSKLWERGMEAAEYRSKMLPIEHVAGYTYRNIYIPVGIPERKKYTSNIETILKKAGVIGIPIANVILSEKNPNFIIRIGYATSEDLEEVVRKVKKEVLTQFGFQLLYKPYTIGN